MMIDRINPGDDSAKPRFGDVMNSPEKFFNHPNDVVNSNGFTLEQKVTLLKQWQNDLNSRHEAETEGMDRSGNVRKGLLPAVTDVLIELGVQTTPSEDNRS